MIIVKDQRLQEDGERKPISEITLDQFEQDYYSDNSKFKAIEFNDPNSGTVYYSGNPNVVRNSMGSYVIYEDYRKFRVSVKKQNIAKVWDDQPGKAIRIVCKNGTTVSLIGRIFN